MSDTVETILGSRIQHGPANDRIYLMKLGPTQRDVLVERLDELAARAGYSKIFAKVPRSARALFRDSGYREEAYVEGFYRGEEGCCFMGKYPDPARRELPVHDKRAIEDIIERAERGRLEGTRPGLAEETVHELGPDDAEAIAAVHGQVFASYPFPIDDPAYIASTMDDDVRYFGVVEDGALVAVSSAEQDPESSNVEMTDFATLPSHRGRGLASTLLVAMDEAMTRAGIVTAYTIARAHSVGMNMVFARCGYHHSGTLVNNTDICGSIESMNVWAKPLASSE